MIMILCIASDFRFLVFHGIIGLLVAVIGFYSYLWYVNKKNQQQQAVFIMVDKIIGEYI